MGEPGEQSNGLSEVLRLRLVEVEDDRQVAAPAEFLPQPLQHDNPAFGEPPKQQHALSTDRVDYVADFLVVEEQVDELSYLDVVDGDRGLACAGNDQVLLFCVFAEFHIPCGYAVDTTSIENRVSIGVEKGPPSAWKKDPS